MEKRGARTKPGVTNAARSLTRQESGYCLSLRVTSKEATGRACQKRALRRQLLPGLLGM